jgi:hypothetical protein
MTLSVFGSELISFLDRDSGDDPRPVVPIGTAWR